jgi:hypothetical protein
VPGSPTQVAVALAGFGIDVSEALVRRVQVTISGVKLGGERDGSGRAEDPAPCSIPD